MSRAKLVRLFNAKARCWFTQAHAAHVYRLLEPKLTTEERRRVGIAWEHSRLGQGHGELDTLCKELEGTAR